MCLFIHYVESTEKRERMKTEIENTMRISLTVFESVIKIEQKKALYTSIIVYLSPNLLHFR